MVKLALIILCLMASVTIAQELRAAENEATQGGNVQSAFQVQDPRTRSLWRKSSRFKSGYDWMKDEKPRISRDSDESNSSTEEPSSSDSNAGYGKQVNDRGGSEKWWNGNSWKTRGFHKSSSKTEPSTSSTDTTIPPIATVNEEQGDESIAKASVKKKSSGKNVDPIARMKGSENGSDKGSDGFKKAYNEMKKYFDGDCYPMTEKFPSFGTLTFDRAIDIQAAEEALCYSLNSQFTELCSPGFLKCIKATVLPLEQPGVGGNASNKYTFTSTTRCGQRCPENKRISVRRTNLRYLEGEGRLLDSAFSSDYIDSCQCPNGKEDAGRLPSWNEIVGTVNARLESVGQGFKLVSFTEDISQDDTCERSDIVEESVSVEAALYDCNNQVLENFCEVLMTSFNKLSAGECDPLFTTIDSCEQVGFEPDETPWGLERRRGRYTYSITARRSNRRIDADRISGRRGLQEKQVKVTRTHERFLPEEQLLDGGEVAIEQCKCITESDDPTFEPVSLEDWIVESQRELDLLCVKAEIDTIELEE